MVPNKLIQKLLAPASVEVPNLKQCLMLASDYSGKSTLSQYMTVPCGLCGSPHVDKRLITIPHDFEKNPGVCDGQ